MLYKYFAFAGWLEIFKVQRLVFFWNSCWEGAVSRLTLIVPRTCWMISSGAMFCRTSVSTTLFKRSTSLPGWLLDVAHAHSLTSCWSLSNFCSISVRTEIRSIRRSLTSPPSGSKVKVRTGKVTKYTTAALCLQQKHRYDDCKYKR